MMIISISIPVCDVCVVHSSGFSLLIHLERMPPNLWKAPAKTREVMAMSFIRMLMEGPLVSFRGSPTVSPTTAALWVEVPLAWTPSPSISSLPASMNFFALSHAPPELEKLTATYTPLTIAPARRPQTPREPTRKPMARGDASTRKPGATMLAREAWVEMAMHRS